MLQFPSPVAIFKGTPNLDAAKKFVDYLLSEEGQKILAEQGHIARSQRHHPAQGI